MDRYWGGGIQEYSCIDFAVNQGPRVGFGQEGGHKYSKIISTTQVPLGHLPDQLVPTPIRAVDPQLKEKLLQVEKNYPKTLMYMYGLMVAFNHVRVVPVTGGQN